MHGKHLLAKIAFASVTFVFTAFVFANTYEVVFNRDIAFADSIQKVTDQQVINDAISDFATKPTADTSARNASLEHMDHFEIPALKMHVKIEESRKVHGLWYERPSTAHDIGLNKDQYNTTVDYLLYTSKSWRTIPHPEQIEQGMEVRLYYGHGDVSSFTVAEKKVLTFDHSLLVSKSADRQLLLVVEDPGSGVYYGYSLVLRT
jgi:hypothetical protein